MKTLNKNEMRAIEGGKTYECKKCNITFDRWWPYAQHMIGGIFNSLHWM